MTNSYSPEPDLTDPAIEPLRLQQLAQTHPHLWDEILDHPNVYPGLADWIRDRQAEQNDAEQSEQNDAEQSEQNDAEQAEQPEPSDDEHSAVEHSDVDEPAVSDTYDDSRPAAVNSWFQQPSEQEQAAEEDWPTEDDQPVDDEPVDEPIDEPRDEPADQAAETTTETATQSFDEQVWAQPSPTQLTESTQQQAWTQPNYGYDQAPQQHSYQDQTHQYQSYAGQASQGFEQPGQGFSQQQTGYQQQYAQPGPYAGQQPPYERRTASRIDLNSRRTWGSFIAGGAAFLALFAFFFTPTAGPSPMPGISHFASGGWVLLLMLIATVTLSVIDLLMPSRWTRYFFVVLGVGTAFAVIGRYMTLIGVLSFYGAGFSLVWLLFTALILLAGIMIYFAPEISQPGQQPPRQPQQFQYEATQNPAAPEQYGSAAQQYGSGAQQYGGYGQQQQHFGRYQPPQNPGSPQ